MSDESDGSGGESEDGAGSAAARLGESTGDTSAGRPSDLASESAGVSTDAPAAREAVAESESWWESLPDELRNDEHVQRYKTPADAAKALVEGRKALSNAIQLPGKDASAEDLAKFYNQLGRPASAEGYELPEIEGYEFSDADRESLKGMQEFAHRIGLSKSQFAHMLGWQTETALATANADRQAQAKAAAQGFKALDEAWGVARDENYAIASKAKVLIGLSDKELDALGDALSTEPGKGHALIVQALHRIGSKTMEGDLGGALDRDAPGELAGRTVGELKDMHAAMMREPNYWNDAATQAKATRISQRIVQLENRGSKVA